MRRGQSVALDIFGEGSMDIFEHPNHLKLVLVSQNHKCQRGSGWSPQLPIDPIRIGSTDMDRIALDLPPV